MLCERFPVGFMTKGSQGCWIQTNERVEVRAGKTGVCTTLLNAAVTKSPTPLSIVALMIRYCQSSHKARRRHILCFYEIQSLVEEKGHRPSEGCEPKRGGHHGVEEPSRSLGRRRTYGICTSEESRQNKFSTEPRTYPTLIFIKGFYGLNGVRQNS